VSLSGNRVVVGGINKACLFNATTGTLIASLANPSVAAMNGFGGSVSVSSNTVIVGAYANDTVAEDSGQAYVFDATTGALKDTLVNPLPPTLDHFWRLSFACRETRSSSRLLMMTLRTPIKGRLCYSLDSGTITPPVVASVAPFVGPTTGGITVVINGASFPRRGRTPRA